MTKLNEYIEAASRGDILGMRQAKDDGVDIHATSYYKCNAYILAAGNGFTEAMKQARDDGVKTD